MLGETDQVLRLTCFFNAKKKCTDDSLMQFMGAKENCRRKFLLEGVGGKLHTTYDRCCDICNANTHSVQVGYRSDKIIN